MKKFLYAAFKITLFQIFLIVFFSILKYVLITYKLIDKIQKPFIWICLGAGILFLLAVSIIGVVENKGESYEKWQVKPEKSGKEKFLGTFVTWGLAIPTALIYLLFLYVVAPTSLGLFIALYAGIVIRNIFQFFSKKNASLNREIN